MNSRERVMRALRRDGPDRVPLQFDLCRPLLEAFGAQHGIPVNYSPSYYEDLKYRTSGNELRIAMGSDCVVVGGGLPAGYEPATEPRWLLVNEFGMRMSRASQWMDVVSGPLANVTTVEEVVALPFPDPFAEGRFDVRQGHHRPLQGRVLHHRRRRADDVRDGLAHGRPREVHGTTWPWARTTSRSLIDRCKDFSIGIGKRLVELGVDGIWAGDDFGAQNGMMISPRHVARHLQAPLRRGLRGLQGGQPRRPDRCTTATAPSRRSSTT